MDATKEICTAFDQLHGRVTGNDFFGEDSDSDVKEECVRNKISEEENFVVGGETEQCVEAFSDQEPEDLSTGLPMSDEKQSEVALEAEVGIVDMTPTVNGNSQPEVMETEEVKDECAPESSKIETLQVKGELCDETSPVEGTTFAGTLSVSDDTKVADPCDPKEAAAGEAGHCINSVDTHSVMGNEAAAPLKGTIETPGEVAVDTVTKSDSLFDLDDDLPMTTVRRSSPQLAYKKRPKPPKPVKPVLPEETPAAATSNGVVKVEAERPEELKPKQVRTQKKTLVKTAVKEQFIKAKRRKQIRNDSDDEASPEYEGGSNKADGDEPQGEVRRDKRARRNCTLKATPKTVTYSVMPKQRKVSTKASKGSQVSGMQAEKCTSNVSENVDGIDNSSVPEKSGVEISGKSPGGRAISGHETSKGKALDSQATEGEISVKSESKSDDVMNSAVKVSGGGVYQRRKQGQRPKGSVPQISVGFALLLPIFCSLSGLVTIIIDLYHVACRSAGGQGKSAEAKAG